MFKHLRYNGAAQTLHWLIALLVVIQFVLAKMAAPLSLGARKLALLADHKSIGMTVFVLAVIRIAWRVKSPPPPLPTEMHRTERTVAAATHASLYMLLFAMPVSGWLMSSAKNYSVSWFSIFVWPNLIGPNEAVFGWLKALHHALGNGLLAIASLHVLGAIKHHFWNRDGILLRMLPDILPRNRP